PILGPAHLVVQALDRGVDGGHEIAVGGRRREHVVASGEREPDRAAELLGGEGGARLDQGGQQPADAGHLAGDGVLEVSIELDPAATDDQLHRVYLMGAGWWPPTAPSCGLRLASLLSAALRRQPALVRRQDAELLAILGDGSTRDGEPPTLEDLRHLL